MAALGIFSLAGATTLKVSDVNTADIVGEHHEKETNEDGSTKTNERWQPLESVVLGGYSFTFTAPEKGTAPAIYGGSTMTVRVYNGCSMTVTAPAGQTMGTIKMTCAKAPNAGCVTATAGSVGIDKTVVSWAGDPAASVTFNFTGTVQIKEFEISGDTGTVPTDATFSLVNTLEGGKYVLVVNEDGTDKLAAPATDADLTKGYGRMGLGNVTVSNNTVATAESNAITIEITDKTATIKSGDYYYGMDDSHFTSFQFYKEVNDGCYWTWEFTGNTVKFSNAKNTDCIIAQSKGDTSWYANVAPAKAPAEFNLPMLFKMGSTGVDSAIVDENAPVEYFDFNGRRVMNPENGMFIKRQGSTVTKVVIR